jgi:membrane protein implicated in regulation of membrane protease activity
MVAGWSIAAFIAGLTLLAVELAYPRRYLGVLGLDLAVLGLLSMFLPEDLGLGTRILVLAVAGAASTALAIPFYRRYAPHVGPMTAPMVGAGDLGRVEQPITPTKEGLVRAGKILWSARADQDIPVGARVRILVIEQDRLWVEADLDAAPHEGDEHQSGAHAHD